MGFMFQIGDGSKLTVGEKLKTPGTDFGCPLEVAYRPTALSKLRSNEFMVVRRRGHTAWSGVGSKTYYETKYMLIRVFMHHCSAKDSVSGSAWSSLMGEEVAEERAGRNWRECLKRLSAKCDELQGRGLIKRHPS